LAEEIKRINVRIGGMSYQLVSSENEAYTRSIALKADEMIRRVMQNNPQLSLGMSTVLALVNSLDELAKVLQHFHSLDSQRQESEKQTAEMRKELMRLREQNWEMKKELLRINGLLGEYETLLARFSPSGPSQENQPDTGPENADPSMSEMMKDEGKKEPAAKPSQGQQEGTQAKSLSSDYPSDRLKQTNLEDYLRENGWPQSYDP
jgi:cell division protein ZapA (FtsZ GTPase activity inhibitor)